MLQRDSVNTPLLEAKNIVQEFELRGPNRASRGKVRAVSDVSFTIRSGETLGIVGETGSGKSTLARTLLFAPRPKTGSVFLEGADLGQLHRKELRDVRAKIQMVFQDPFSSLDPIQSIESIVREPLDVRNVGTRASREIRVLELLKMVGLDPRTFADRRPRELSGGQNQRVAIARALALSPQLLICDEALSALDVSVQAQILNLLERLRTELSLAYLFISHDLGVVRHMSDRVAIMYLGRMCEIGPSQAIYASPLHPYTAALLASAPLQTASTANYLPSVSADLPSSLDPPSGCRYRTRCPYAQTRCADETPELREIAPGHTVACHFPQFVEQAGSNEERLMITSRK